MSDVREVLLKEFKTLGYVFKKTNDTKSVYLYTENVGDLIVSISLGLTKSSVAIKSVGQNKYTNIIKYADFNTSVVKVSQLLNKFKNYHYACSSFNTVIKEGVAPNIVSSGLSFDPLVEALKS